MSKGIRIEGLDEVVASFDDIGNVNEIEATIGRACALVERSAKQKAPKGDGALRRSITSKVQNLQLKN